MRKTVAGAVLGAALLAVVGCGGNKDQPVQYKDPGLDIKPLPAPGRPGGDAPAAPTRGKANAGANANAQ
jgi:hypothetical protein